MGDDCRESARPTSVGGLTHVVSSQRISLVTADISGAIATWIVVRRFRLIENHTDLLIHGIRFTSIAFLRNVGAIVDHMYLSSTWRQHLTIACVGPSDVGFGITR